MQAVSRFGFRRWVRALLLVLPVVSSLVFLAGSPIPVDAVAGSRLTGSTRAQTAVAIAKKVAGGDLKNLTGIIVVSDRSVVDAALATSLAGVLDTCDSPTTCRTAVLVTGPTTLDADTATAIRQSGLSPGQLIVIGGPGALSDDVRAAIARTAGWNGVGNNPIIRLGGPTRYDTALAVAGYVTAPKRAMAGDTPATAFDTLIVVNGDRPADLLLAASLAHGLGQLIVLTRPNDLPDASRWMFALTQPQRVTIIGGTTTTTPTLETALRNLLPTSGALTRIGGTDRYETSTLVANLLATDGVTNIAIVSGIHLTDTTTMGLLAQPGAPILYVTPTNIPASVTTWLKANSRLGIIITTIGNTPDTITQTINNTITTSTPPTGTPTPPPAPDPDPTLPYFAIEVTVTAPTLSATLPLRGDIDVTINWGAAGLTCPTSKTGSGVTTDAGNVTCTYPTAGTYLIRLDPNTGPGPWLTGFGDPIVYPHANVIRRVRGWGNLGLTNLRGAFKSATNLTWVAPPPSAVTDMSSMFADATAFNQNINGWNTANVTNMSYMFWGATAFNQPISNWNTASVSAMRFMFASATAFNQDISAWNTARVADMHRMFEGATAFNQNINTWNTANVTNMSNMFEGATAFNNGCSPGSYTCALTITTSAVTTMETMFGRATTFNQDISSWDTASVSAMTNMFYSATAFNQPISDWDTSNVTNMSNMFSNALAFNQPISNWNTSNVTNMSYMFFNATAFNQPIGNITTSAVTNMEGMFRGAVNFNQNIGNITTSAVTNMGNMFAGATAFNNGCPAGSTTSACPLQWNTGNVANMYGMFAGATSFNQNIGDWDTSNVTNMSYMFAGASAFNQNISGWDTASVSAMTSMFDSATAFNNGCSLGIYTCALTITTSAVTDMSYMFYYATGFNQDISSWDTASVSAMTSMFDSAIAFNNGCSPGSYTCALTITTSAVTDMETMFYNATLFNQNISGWDTSDVTDMYGMFMGATNFNNGCAEGSTTSACPLNWNTVSVSAMSYMFSGATAFNQDLSSWSTTSIVGPRPPTGFATGATAWLRPRPTF